METPDGSISLPAAARRPPTDGSELPGVAPVVPLGVRRTSEAEPAGRRLALAVELHVPPPAHLQPLARPPASADREAPPAVLSPRRLPRERLPALKMAREARVARAGRSARYPQRTRQSILQPPP